MKYILRVRYKGKAYYFRADGLWSNKRDKARKFTDAKAVHAVVRDARNTLKHLRHLTIEAVGVERGLRKNPSSRGDAMFRADALLESFTGHKATKELRVRARQIKTGLVVGPMTGVMYAADRGDGVHEYCHRFKKSSRPLLIADHDGSQLGIVGGRFRFTDRGIVDC